MRRKALFLYPRKEDFMEIKINKEIKEFKETMFFGLSLRQCIFTLLAIVTAVALYLLLQPLGSEPASWGAIIGAVPWALFGYGKYNSMRIEKVIVAWWRTKVRMPLKLTYKSTNLYQELLNQPKERKSK